MHTFWSVAWTGKRRVTNRYLLAGYIVPELIPLLSSWNASRTLRITSFRPMKQKKLKTVLQSFQVCESLAIFYLKTTNMESDNATDDHN